MLSYFKIILFFLLYRMSKKNNGKGNREKRVNASKHQQDK